MKTFFKKETGKKTMRNNKKGIEFNFAWMFAIIVGAVIIFLAIYGSTKLLHTGEKISETEAGKELGILLTPYETGIEEGKATKISLSEEVEISNICSEIGNFGSQKIKLGEEGVPITFYNKYIFSSEKITGKELNVFTMPFRMPFKVADLTMIYSENEKYCFVNAPEDVRKEVEGFGLKNVDIIENNKLNCDKDSIKVCFSGSGCDINVLSGRAERDGKSIYYESEFGNALLYSVIFSSNEIYECQLKRLMKRTVELAGIYTEKSALIRGKDCNTEMEQDLQTLALSSKISSSAELGKVLDAAKIMEDKNENAICKLF